MLCCYKGVVASLVLVVGLLSVPVFATSDWMERPGTIGHALKQQDGTRVYLDAVYVAKNKPYQNPPYFVVREPFDGTALLMVLATPPPELRPWQTVDVEGTLATLPNGDRALVDARTFGYLDREYNLLYHGPLIKGLLRPTPWNWMADLTVYSSPDSLTILTEEDPPPGEPNPDPMPAAVELSTIALAKLEADGTMVTLSCKRIDPTAGTGYFTIAEDDNHNETLKVYYTTTVDTTDRLYRVTGTMKTYNSERILCVNSGPGTVFDPAVDQVGSVQTAALGTIAYVKTLPNETQLDTGSLTGKVVTAIFNVPLTPFFYIQEPVGSGYDYSGIKVVSSASVQIGDLVDIEGTVYGAPAYPECYISPSDVDVVGTDTLPRPVGMNNRATAAGSFGLQPDLYLDVTTDHMKVGAGLNPVGILVRAWGRYFTGSVGGNTTYYIDDGSGLLGSVSAYAHTGLGLWYVPGTSAPVRESGTSFVATTGILGAEWSDSDPQVPVPVLRLDSTPPVIQVTDDGTQTAVTTQLHFSWNVTDVESGITDCYYAVGTSPTDPGSGYTVGWTPAGSVGEATEAATLSPSTTYYVYVKATNGAGLLAAGASNGIAVNTSAHVVDMLSDNKDANGEIKQYEKYEALFSINPAWIGTAFTGYNPFSPKLTAYDTNSTYTWKKLNGIYVDAVITKPDETEIRWPCFYDYDRDSDGVPEWRFRFAPTAEGEWSYHIEVRFGTGTPEVVTGPTRSFICTANNNPVTGRGFLRKDYDATRNPNGDKWLFSFSRGDCASSTDDTPFYPYGVKCVNTTDIESLAGIQNLDGTYPGGNYSRLFSSSRMFEQRYSGSYSSGGDTVNDFRNVGHTPVWDDADYWDELIECARTHGVYLIYLLNDWTWWKDTAAGGSNPYILEGVATSAANCYDYDNTAMREVYMRKLRWMLARWGYSASIIGFDLVNESQLGSSQKLGEDFHSHMAAYVNGATAYSRFMKDGSRQTADVVPSSWPLQTNDAEEQPHHLSGDQTSCRYDTRDIQWDDAEIGMCHFHDYARIGEGWRGIYTDYAKYNPPYYDSNFQDGWETLGSSLASPLSPWMDTAVWMDRMARIQRKSVGWKPGYEKPFSWTEFGLERQSFAGDWNDAYFGRYNSLDDPNSGILYIGDSGGQHARDWFWASIFNKVSGCHWHPAYFNGTGDAHPRPSDNITHWDIFLPLRNFLEDSNHPVDMRGMEQESCYPEDDPLNQDPSIWAEVPNSSPPDRHPNVEIYGVRGANRAYLYIKNVTNTWYYAAGFRDAGLPVPATQTARIRVEGLDTGQTYTVEKWSTRQVADPTSINYTWDGQDMLFDVTLDATSDYAWACKIYVQ